MAGGHEEKDVGVTETLSLQKSPWPLFSFYIENPWSPERLGGFPGVAHTSSQERKPHSAHPRLVNRTMFSRRPEAKEEAQRLTHWSAEGLEPAPSTASLAARGLFST